MQFLSCIYFVKCARGSFVDTSCSILSVHAARVSITHWCTVAVVVWIIAWRLNCSVSISVKQWSRLPGHGSIRCGVWTRQYDAVSGHGSTMRCLVGTAVRCGVWPRLGAASHSAPGHSYSSVQLALTVCSCVRVAFWSAAAGMNAGLKKRIEPIIGTIFICYLKDK